MRPHPAFSLLLLLSLAGCGVVPGSKPAERVARQAGSVPVSTARPEMRQCNAELGQTGSRFAPLPDKFYGAGCSTTNSVRLERVGGDHTEFTVTNLGAVACPLANSFAGWARYGVDRAAQQILGSPLQRIETMGSFACRNVAGSARRSAHARAEAIDVAAFAGFRFSRGGTLHGTSVNSCASFTAAPASGSARYWAPTTTGPMRTIFTWNMAAGTTAARVEPPRAYYIAKGVSSSSFASSRRRTACAE
jgi:hypothetical protein